MGMPKQSGLASPSVGSASGGKMSTRSGTLWAWLEVSEALS